MIFLILLIEVLLAVTVIMRKQTVRVFFLLMDIAIM